MLACMPLGLIAIVSQQTKFKGEYHFFFFFMTEKGTLYKLIQFELKKRAKPRTAYLLSLSIKLYNKRALGEHELMCFLFLGRSLSDA